jgi:hypothetical protein
MLFFLGLVLGLDLRADHASASAGVEAQTEKRTESVTAVKYRSGKEIRFDELLIQGQMKRAEMSVVTGDSDPASDGLLRLRDQFLDHAALDLGESEFESNATATEARR